MRGDRLLSDMCNSFIQLPSKKLGLMMHLVMGVSSLCFTSMVWLLTLSMGIEIVWARHCGSHVTKLKVRLLEMTHRSYI